MRRLMKLWCVPFVGLSMAILVAGCAKPTTPPEGESSQAEAGTPADETSSASEKTTTENSGAMQQANEPVETATKPETPAAKPAESPTAEKVSVTLGDPSLTAGIAGEGPLKIEEITAWLADPTNHAVLDIRLPMGLDAGQGQIKGVAENPLTRAKIELGRQLYFDRRLSIDNTVSCADCHSPDEGWARHTQFGIGVKGQQGGRNSPVSYNRILSDRQFWDGRAPSLEAQAVGPIANPIEMGFTHDACVKRLAGIEGYRLQFEKIFGDVTIENVAKAIASFERSIVSGPSPFDYYERFKPFEEYSDEDIEGLKEDDPDQYAAYGVAKKGTDEHPMSDSAKRGMKLFFGQKAGCTACHVGANLTDEKYWHIGIGLTAEKPDLGRALADGELPKKGFDGFKTPTIRNVAQSSPYMHDGSLQSLSDVVEHYNKGGITDPNKAEQIKKYVPTDKIKPLNLTDQEKADLVAFMEACTGEFPPVERERQPQ